MLSPLFCPARLCEAYDPGTNGPACGSIHDRARLEFTPEQHLARATIVQAILDADQRSFRRDCWESISSDEKRAVRFWLDADPDAEFWFVAGSTSRDEVRRIRAALQTIAHDRRRVAQLLHDWAEG